MKVQTDLFALQPNCQVFPGNSKLKVARPVNGFGPIYFGSVVHLNIENYPAVKEGIGVVVLMTEDVMWYPFYWALLKRRPRGCDQVKVRRRRLDDVVDVGTLNQSGETVAPKVHGPSSDAMKRANLANHGSHAKIPATSLRYALRPVGAPR
jgi:hypothetical protein